MNGPAFHLLPKHHPFSQWIMGLPAMSSLRPYSVGESVSNQRYIFKWASLATVREIQRILSESEHMSARCSHLHEGSGPQSCTMVIELLPPKQLALLPAIETLVEQPEVVATPEAPQTDDEILEKVRRNNFLVHNIPSQGCYQQFSY